jgi:serine protease Do
VGRDSGIEVIQVVEGSPAHRAGVTSKDLLLAIDGVELERMEDLQRVMDATVAGAAVTLTVFRDGRARDLKVVPGELSA